MIKDVPKTLVYRLCRYRNARAGHDLVPESVLTKAPSAELRPDQRDDQSLPPYEVLDPLLDALVLHDRSIADVAASGYDPTLVVRVASLVDGAEYKRRQSPPGVRITAKAFGKDRRMPITNRYRDPAPETVPATADAPTGADDGAVPVVDRSDAAALAIGGAGVDGGPGPGGPALSLEAAARLVGSYQWVERRLFEVLGSWVASEPVPEAQVLFDVYSQQHAWHAELFADRLPALDSVDPVSLVLPPSVEVDRMLAVLAGVVPDDDPDSSDASGVPRGGRLEVHPGGTLPRLVGIGRVVLARLVTGYSLHLRRVSPVADAPITRCLRLVLRDETEEWQALEALTQALLRRPHDVAVVTGHQQRLEEMIAEAGAGLVPWPIGPDAPGATTTST